MDLVGKMMMVRQDLMRHDRGEYVYMTGDIYDRRGKPGRVVEKHEGMPIYRLEVGDRVIGWIQEDWLVPALIDNRSL